MDRKTLDRAVPLVYAVLVILAAIFVHVAVAPIAIFGAFAVAAWFSVLRPTMKARERARNGDDRPYWY